MDEVESSGGRVGRYRRRVVGGRRPFKVKIALSEDEYVRLHSLAAARGVSAPMLCLQSVFAGDVVRAAELAHLRSDLSVVWRLLIGASTNLNQLAKAANSGEPVSSAQVLAYANAIEGYARQVRELADSIPRDGVLS